MTGPVIFGRASRPPLLSGHLSVQQVIGARRVRKSAEQSFPPALLLLGHCLIDGRGVAKNRIEGLSWMMAGQDDYDDEDRAEVLKIAEDYTEEEMKTVKLLREKIVSQLKDK